MMTLALVHSGQAPAPHDLSGVWNVDPLLLLGSVVAA